MYLTTRGLVLRVSDYNDRDALLTLLTPEHGKITVKARGLRRKNSPLTAPCQLLALGEFTLFEYRDSYSINEAHSIELFQGLRKDIVKLSLGTYFAQVAQLLSMEDTPNPELLSLVLNCLYALSEMQMRENQVKAAFELRCACLSGYTPDLFACYICGNQEPDRFDVSNGMLSCASCRGQGEPGLRMPLTASVLNAMRYIVSSEPKRLLSFDASDETLKQLSQITELYLTTQLERGFSALDFYKSLFL